MLVWPSSYLLPDCAPSASMSATTAGPIASGTSMASPVAQLKRKLSLSKGQGLADDPIVLSSDSELPPKVKKHRVCKAKAEGNSKRSKGKGKGRACDIIELSD